VVLKLGHGFFNGIGVFFGADGTPQATIAHLLLCCGVLGSLFQANKKIPFKKDQSICPYNHMKSKVMDCGKFVKKYGKKRYLQHR
jgi:hypothetical protein